MRSRISCLLDDGVALVSDSLAGASAFRKSESDGSASGAGLASSGMVGSESAVSAGVASLLLTRCRLLALGQRFPGRRLLVGVYVGCPRMSMLLRRLLLGGVSFGDSDFVDPDDDRLLLFRMGLRNLSERFCNCYFNFALKLRRLRVRSAVLKNCLRFLSVLRKKIYL